MGGAEPLSSGFAVNVLSDGAPGRWSSHPHPRREKPTALPPWRTCLRKGVREGGWCLPLLSWKAGKQILSQCRPTVPGADRTDGSKPPPRALGGLNTGTAHTEPAGP